ncbi:cell division ATP-binding protein FtsE [bacterium (Candidatus Gribaldobacteria) CG_4_10_14_0_2_um_filter_41_16]|uniref:Cell division ATP-binding protein FtsE n=1 Tax=bacterium (Candidatus Gribaldobacteria) CG_4_10_14_0_2_um_filter_41_16 TaxID=2014265 RepID=A0A2M7VJ07_9BACT|nr:MAG: cell division ATP-binding protein FtsE [Parcubacteria group bacterium CG1_02_40_25]PJA01822.1 MAG: cell division ATP-binding protein FtsE [bacterium (Candidatus Gribaldobacteria) CG_4_10_14_0_2_um_filter_41_16]
MILFKNVWKIYPPNCVALREVDLKIQDKEFLSIAGPSGAGKSTIMRLLIGEEKPDRGVVMLSGINIAKLKQHDLPYLRRRIGMIFQDFKLLPDKTAFENVAFAMEVAGYGHKEVDRDVPQVLGLVGLADKHEAFPRQLSGGEKQRVAIARALIHRPELLIADEPTGNLDLLHTWDIVRLLLKINEMGTTVILATHDREIINTLQKRVVTIDKGKIVRDEEKGRYVL